MYRRRERDKETERSFTNREIRHRVLDRRNRLEVNTAEELSEFLHVGISWIILWREGLPFLQSLSSYQSDNIPENRTSLLNISFLIAQVADFIRRITKNYIIHHYKF